MLSFIFIDLFLSKKKHIQLIGTAYMKLSQALRFVHLSFENCVPLNIR